MQFIKHGPDIPEALLQAHEEGRVVFFCGAGISYPLSLPGFQGLVDLIYSDLGEVRSPIEDKAYRKEQYDAALDLLERRLRSRMALRKPLLTILRPKQLTKRTIRTHQALLQLSKDRAGAVRLVTTNFDRVFQHVMKKTNPPIPYFAAPMLPIPKDSRWHGLVYLHGLMPEFAEEGALNRLVLTSGDFGLAYLTERWASRFVTELFRGYVVCFVGYSINDPVLRYMMDALAADRRMGETTSQAYAFGESRPGEEDGNREEWEAKGVVPVLYRVPAGSHDHSALHKTLAAWADTYRDGVVGLERIVVQCATGMPLASTKEDDFVGRALWALADSSGLPAKRFAEFDPVPSLDWLEPFSETRFRQGSLIRFGVPPTLEMDDELAFGLLHRPSSYTRAPWMGITARAVYGSGWDHVMSQMARWLIRHLDDPRLILWLVKNGGQLDPQFQWDVGKKLEELDRMITEGKDEEFARLRANAPSAVPRPNMRTLWRLLLAGRVRSPWRQMDLFRWKETFKRDGLTPVVRMGLREALTPQVEMKQPFRWAGRKVAKEERPERITDLIAVEVVLSSDYAATALQDLRATPAFRLQLPALLADFQHLLLEALELLRELGAASDLSDNSYFDQPSISPHRQNRGFKEWVILFDLVREAWLATVEQDQAKARRIVEDWWSIPYPGFKRLALFAAGNTELVPSGTWVEWLLVQGGWWLWSPEVKRETIRLLVLKGINLSAAEQTRLEGGILTGPPRRMFQEDLSGSRWKELVDRAIWLCLAKLEAGSVRLSKQAKGRLTRISKANPRWNLATNESDEFSFWMSGTGDPDYESRRQIVRAPRTRPELVEWLPRPIPTDQFSYDDDWRVVCRDRFPLAATALYVLSERGVWPANRWAEALLTWGTDQQGYRSWRYMAPVVERMPTVMVDGMASHLARWIESASKRIRVHQAIFKKMVDLILGLSYQEPEGDSKPVDAAINHPVGMITEALVQDWFTDALDDGKGLRPDFKDIVSRLCDKAIPHFRHARVILGRNLVSLFRVDPAWTTANLLPAFSWGASAVEAQGVWEGFLWAPRLHWPLMDVLKLDFLATASHYSELHEHGRQYVGLLADASLDPGSVFSRQELRRAFTVLPDEALVEAILTLIQVLEAAGEKKKECWEHKILSFWRFVWPKDRVLSCKGYGEKLAILAIVSGDAFPLAVETLLDYFHPVEYCHWMVSRLHEAKLCARFPQDSLTLLDKAISDRPDWIPKELAECLEAIQTGWPQVIEDRRFQRISVLARRAV